MKKLVLTMVALVAMATTSFAQFSSSELAAIARAMDSYSVPSVSYSVPSVSYSVPSVTYSVPSTVNFNTTTVSGYTRSNGTYVSSHIRTMPNSTNWDNFSTKGNSNPFTGSTGYRARDYSSSAYNYGAGHTIHTGSRGGQYYINSNGNRTYVPKRNLW
jgi:type IV secretory pathway ATPase VirB11/archaellum biosynthesis ATPase